MDDFKRSLPMKFILGLLLLSGAVQAMIVTFVAGFFITFKQKLLEFAYPIAAIPAIFFIVLHFPLFIHVNYSTFTGFFLFISKMTMGFFRAVAYVAAELDDPTPRSYYIKRLYSVEIPGF
ncbi:hypothetical protein M5689_022777 [Euphorbia peplus]|nr:hypothetical protein M5689_022777 [Euphorbia peplus]